MSNAAIPGPRPAPGDPATPGPVAGSGSDTVPPHCPARTRLHRKGQLVAEGSPTPEISDQLEADTDAVVWLDLFDVVEIWQADASGRLDVRAGWFGFGRSLVDADGRYRFRTVRPGALGDGSAPHVAVSVFARGLLQRLVTRIYLPDEPANDADPVLATLDPGRRPTLIAADVDGALVHGASSGRPTVPDAAGRTRQTGDARSSCSRSPVGTP